MPKQPILNPELLTAALAGLEAQRQQIDSRIAEVRRMLGSRAAATARATPASSQKRVMSAAAKARIAEAQRKRWAEFHKEQGTAPRKGAGPAASKPAHARPRKRRLSPEGRRRIIEATKKRWAAVRAAQKKAAKAK
jgi:hypothetical protein